MFGLIPLLITKGFTERASKAIAILLAILAVIGLFFAAWFVIVKLYNHHNAVVVENYGKDLSIEAANIVQEANHNAALNQQQNEATFDNKTDEIKESINEAQRTRTSPLDAVFDKLQ